MKYNYHRFALRGELDSMAWRDGNGVAKNLEWWTLEHYGKQRVTHTMGTSEAGSGGGSAVCRIS